MYMCVYIYICMQHLEENCYCGGIEAPLLLDRIKRYLENYFSLFVPFRSLPFRVVGIDFERGKILETILLPFSFKCLLKRKNCLSSSFFPLSNKNLFFPKNFLISIKNFGNRLYRFGNRNLPSIGDRKK